MFKPAQKSHHATKISSEVWIVLPVHFTSQSFCLKEFAAFFLSLFFLNVILLFHKEGFRGKFYIYERGHQKILSTHGM